MKVSTEVRLRQILSSSPAIIYTCRAGGDYSATFVSDNFSHRFGYASHEFLNQPNFWRNNIHPDDQERVFADYGRLFENGYHVHEYRFRKKNGDYVWVHDELQLICNDDGKPEEIVGSWLDITESQETKAALQKSETLFQEFFHLNPIASIVSDPSGVIHMVNPAFSRASGLSNEDVAGKTSLELGFWRYEKDRERMVKAIKEKGYINNLETQFYGKDGKLMTCLLSSRAINYGDEVRILNVLIDVTEQKNVQESLRKSEQLFRTFFETNPIATIISSADGRIHRVNAEFERTTGFSSVEVVGKTAQEMNFWRDLEDRNKMVAAVEESGYLDNFESNFFGKNDTPMTCLISSRAITHEGETRILSTVFDITEQRKAEESIKKLEKAKRDFISMAAHELRTPLIAIVGYCELLENSDKIALPDKTKQDYLEIIQTNAEVLNCLVNDLLDMGRIQVGRPLGISKRDTELAPLVEKVVSSARLKSALHEIVVEKDAEFPKSIFADSGRVTQVLHNLLSNAIKFSPEGGVVTVAMSGSAGYANISVVDQGVGMEQHEVEKVFQQHYRADPESSKTRGLGLGLSIVKQIVEDHSGTIEVISSPGKGTTVSVQLPVK
jgi:PAS domain S-box-containing protein